MVEPGIKNQWLLPPTKPKILKIIESQKLIFNTCITSLFENRLSYNVSENFRKRSADLDDRDRNKRISIKRSRELERDRNRERVKK